jgi:hypothetical protein
LPLRDIDKPLPLAFGENAIAPFQFWLAKNTNHCARILPCLESLAVSRASAEIERENGLKRFYGTLYHNLWGCAVQPYTTSAVMVS